jgi:hypothetical protein
MKYHLLVFVRNIVNASHYAQMALDNRIFVNTYFNSITRLVEKLATAETIKYWIGSIIDNIMSGDWREGISLSGIDTTLQTHSILLLE